MKTLEGNYDNALRHTKQGCKDKPASAGCDMTEAIAEAQQVNEDRAAKAEAVADAEEVAEETAEETEEVKEEEA